MNRPRTAAGYRRELRNKSWPNRIRFLVFDTIRLIFWKSYDANEDFVCGWCGKEVYGRQLYCSQGCEFRHLREQIKKAESEDPAFYKPEDLT